MGLYVDSLLNGTDNTARMEKIYTEMVEVLLELERTQGNNDIELDLLLGVYHTIGYEVGITSRTCGWLRNAFRMFCGKIPILSQAITV